MNPSEESKARRILARLADGIPPGDPKLTTLVSELGAELGRIESQQAEQAEQLEQFAQAYEKLTSPANRIGVFLAPHGDDNALIAFGDTEYVAKVDPSLEQKEGLARGARVLLNEAYAIIGFLPPHEGGMIVKVSESLEDGRLRISSDPQMTSGRFVWRGALLEDLKIEAGDEVRVEPMGRVAVEHFAHNEVRDYFVEDVPEIEWAQIGGQQEAIKLIRDTIEQPLLYPELFRKFDKKPVKGILLYGPPGCGKTLIGKATAYNLAKEYSAKVGREVKECFLSVSGPKILNMWLGESERMVREIFDVARRKAKEGQLVVIFLDEAESILRTRSSGRWLNISNTVVPQFCAEMDGVLGLENVVVILTSNRPDYIDPAILRPERIDRKVKVNRPDAESTRQILSIYLREELPADPGLLQQFDGEAACARKELIERAAAALWRKDKESEFLKVYLRNGDSDTLYFKDLISGALLKSVVDRAKDLAIQRAIAEPEADHGLRVEDLEQAIRDEYRENEIFPKTDGVEDWLKLLDYEPENVVSVRPVRETKGETFVRKNIL